MTAIPEDLKSALSGRYDLQKEIGQGGMATVYLAQDLKHKRLVAVKVLRADVSATLGTERFLREIEIAAGLTHPHILPLHDSGEAADLLYYVMPYIAGESLRSRLNAVGRLAVTAALSIVSDVAEALTYAHRKGVIHRDIKPENILFSEGHALVADFGIAKAISTAGGENLTRSGFPLGTPGYMSPEQAAGITDLDEKTDVYALACVFYESVIGCPPGLWLTEEAVRLGRFIKAAPDHRERLDLLPGRLEQVLARALALNAENRHATPMELVEALTDASKGSAKLSDEKVKLILAKAAELQEENPTVDGRLNIEMVEQVAGEAGIPPARVREAAQGMPHGSDAGYTDSEVREVLRRAAALDAMRNSQGDALSIGAVEQVAAEIGIPPDQVREAARDVELRPDAVLTDKGGAKTGLFNWPQKLEVTRSVNGEVSRDKYVDLVDEMRSALGTTGQISTLGRSLTWSAAPSGGLGRNVSVSIRPSEGRTRIHIEENLAMVGPDMFAPILGASGGAAVGLVFTATIGFLSAPVILLPLGLLGGFMGFNLTSYAIYRSATKKRFPQLSTLANRLAEKVEEIVHGQETLKPGDNFRLSP
jgi:serine/threonine protein kinase